jgi:hypothetical protein
MAATLEERERALRAAEEKTRKAEVELAVTRAHMDIARADPAVALPRIRSRAAAFSMRGAAFPPGPSGGDYFGYFPRGVTGSTR